MSEISKDNSNILINNSIKMTKTYNLGNSEEEKCWSIEDCKNQIELYVKEIDKLVCDKCWVAYYKQYKAYKYETPEKASEAI